MKKIITPFLVVFALAPLFAFAEDATSTASTTPTQTFTLCSKQAIDNRDTEIAQARTTYNTENSTALNERKESEKSAIEIQDIDKRKEAIKVAAEAYRSSTRSAQEKLTDARREIWSQFEEDIKSCQAERKDNTEKRLAEEKELKNDKKELKEEQRGEIKQIKSERNELLEEKKEEIKTIRESFKEQLQALFSFFRK